MKRFKYITPEQAIYYQQKIVEETGGSIGLRDLGLLESALARPQASFDGEDLYPTILDKAAALFHSLIFNHPFLDGNKRTTLGVTYEFLKQNGYRLETSMQELIDFPLRVENKHLSLEEIKKWLKWHTKKRVLNKAGELLGRLTVKGRFKLFFYFLNLLLIARSI